MFELLGRHGRSSALTRISVRGSRGVYLVRNGDDEAVWVYTTPHGLRCGCGATNCSHVASLLLCGFVEPPCEGRQAA